MHLWAHYSGAVLLLCNFALLVCFVRLKFFFFLRKTAKREFDELWYQHALVNHPCFSPFQFRFAMLFSAILNQGLGYLLALTIVQAKSSHTSTWLSLSGLIACDIRAKKCQNYAWGSIDPCRRVYIPWQTLDELFSFNLSYTSFCTKRAWKAR